MTLAASHALGPRLKGGIAVGQPGAGITPTHITWIDGAHPVPDERSVRAASTAIELAREARVSGDLVLVLLSGGASAMMAAPADGVSLADKRRTTEALMKAGASIAQLNCVRRHLSRIKGGRLGAEAGACLTLAISDVHTPDDDPVTIGSGPTVGDATTYADAIEVVEDLACDVPASVRTHLARGLAGMIPETPKPGAAELRQATFRVIANRHTAVQGAADEARRRGYTVETIREPTSGEARIAGLQFVEAAIERGSSAALRCTIGSGETTVRVKGNGRGGRNQEFVLGAAAALANAGAAVVLGSAGTDGVDGPTDAAGAIASSSTLARCAALGIDIADVLARNDAYIALAQLGGLLVWGPTLTNVGDIHVMLTMKA
jgi:glycerate 2-kinase